MLECRGRPHERERPEVPPYTHVHTRRCLPHTVAPRARANTRTHFARRSPHTVAPCVCAHAHITHDVRHSAWLSSVCRPGTSSPHIQTHRRGMMRLDKLGGEQGDGGGFTKESGLLRWRTADARGARPAIACRELRRCDASFRLRSARLPRAPAVAPLRQRRRALAMANSSVRRRPSRSLEMKGTEGGFSQMLGALAGGRSRWAKARALPSARLTASQRGLEMSFRNDFAVARSVRLSRRGLS